MNAFVLLSTVASVALGTHHGISYGGAGGHGYGGGGGGHGYGGNGYGRTPLLIQGGHSLSYGHGGEYAAHGDLMGLHSFGLSHDFGHGISLSQGFEGHGYGLPTRSKLYGGYIGGFGGYSKGLQQLDSIPHYSKQTVSFPGGKSAYSFAKQPIVKLNYVSQPVISHHQVPVVHGSFGHGHGHIEAGQGHGHIDAGIGHGHLGAAHGQIASGHGHLESLGQGHAISLGGHHYGGEYRKSKKA